MSGKSKRNKFMKGQKQEQKQKAKKIPGYIIGIIAIISVFGVFFILSNPGRSFFNSLFTKDTTSSLPAPKKVIITNTTPPESVKTDVPKEEPVLLSDEQSDEKTGEKEQDKPVKEETYITIILSELTRQGKYFTYTSANNVTIKYFGLLDKEGQPHVAFDACDVCYRAKKGYALQGDMAICKNCGNKYPVNAIGTENQYGGCWPSYLPIDINGNEVRIKIKDIEANEYMFS